MARNSGLPWAREMVQLLIKQRQEGVRFFPKAWRQAQKHCRLKYIEHPEKHYIAFQDFFYDACRREWNNEVTTDYAGLLAELHLTEHQTADTRTVLLA